MVRSFEKGLADRGGWREEILHMPEIQPSFLYPFCYAALGEGGHISGERFWSPTPSRQPLFETSDVANYGVRNRVVHGVDPMDLRAVALL